MSGPPGLGEAHPPRTARSAVAGALLRLRALLAREFPSLAGIALAAVAFVALYQTGSMADFETTLELMGFDPDRASLIGALAAGGTCAAIVGLVGGRFGLGVLLGAIGALAGFSRTYASETHAAIRSRPPNGVFDPVGWTLTTASLVVAGCVVGWASVVLAADVRRALGGISRAVRTIARRGEGRLRAGRNVAVAAIVVALLVVTMPVVGDMLNYSPDYALRRDAPPVTGLFGGPNPSGGDAGTGGGGGGGDGGLPGEQSPGASTGGAGPSAPGASFDPLSGAIVPPTDLVAGPVAGSFVTPGALSANPPRAVRLAGSSRSVSVNLPAPWVGGRSDQATLDIYLPAGYDASSARYPVIYELEGGKAQWDRSMRFSALMDGLIESGTLPPMIVIFVSQAGGPYTPSECANSWDGKEWFDRYLSETVPAWVDSHLRTIATPAARTLFGFSSGGYCAAAALVNHPGVFGNAISFSGYFVAGIRSRSTPNAWVVFNGDAALEAKVSPYIVAPRVAPELRSKIFMAMSASPDDWFYGLQVTQFAHILDASGIPVAILPTMLGHSWDAIRDQLQAMLTVLVARQARLGVFGGS